MKSVTRTVITLDLDAKMLSQGCFTVHEALLDGDVTYVSATVTGHEDDLWELTLERDAD